MQCSCGHDSVGRCPTQGDEIDQIVDWQLDQERQASELPQGDGQPETEFSCGRCNTTWRGPLDLYRCPECGAEAECATTPA